MSIRSPNCDELIKSYLDVCNQALLRNKNRFPFQQILGAAKDAEQGKLVELDVKDGSRRLSYAMSIKDDQITVKPHGACKDCSCDRRWSVDVEYLTYVTQNPDTHIENPAKINWEWMYDAH